MNKIAEGVALFQKYNIFELNGTVASEMTRSETEVEGSVSGGHSNTPVSGRISSKTTSYQTIFLKDDAGKENVVKLINFVIPCREGHKLTLRGADKMCWFDVINHSTEESFRDNAGLAKYTRPVLVEWALIFVAALIAFIGGIMTSQSDIGAGIFTGVIFALIVMPIMIAVLWLPAKIVSSLRAAQMRRSLKSAIDAPQMT